MNLEKKNGGRRVGGSGELLAGELKTDMLLKKIVIRLFFHL